MIGLEGGCQWVIEVGKVVLHCRTLPAQIGMQPMEIHLVLLWMLTHKSIPLIANLVVRSSAAERNRILSATKGLHAVVASGWVDFSGGVKQRSTYCI